MTCIQGMSNIRLSEAVSRKLSEVKVKYTPRIIRLRFFTQYLWLCLISIDQVRRLGFAPFFSVLTIQQNPRRVKKSWVDTNKRLWFLLLGASTTRVNVVQKSIRQLLSATWGLNYSIQYFDPFSSRRIFFKNLIAHTASKAVPSDENK